MKPFSVSKYNLQIQSILDQIQQPTRLSIVHYWQLGKMAGTLTHKSIGPGLLENYTHNIA